MGENEDEADKGKDDDAHNEMPLTTSCERSDN
jgi:hypothetical protein